MNYTKRLLLVLVALACACGNRAVQSVISSAESEFGQAKTVALDLRTDGFPTPLTISGDPLKREITSIEIKGVLPESGAGKGIIVLDQNQLTFNAFGDATKAKTKLGWEAKTSFEELVKEMVVADLALAERESKYPLSKVIR